ncbi:hypothetical protein BH11GEM2_BH11GEM2_06730 [soil metagenome]
MSYSSIVDKLKADVGELVAKHEQTRDLADFSKYDGRMAAFATEELRCDSMWSKQIEMSERLRDNPRTLVLSANGIGKDYFTARFALYWVYVRRGMVLLTSTTERQVKNILMREVRRAWTQAADLPGELFQMELRVDDDTGILAFTSDRADRLVGFHHPRLLVVLSEGQGIDETAYEAAQACCTSPENRLFVYGNPTAASGPFYRAANNPSWSVLRIPATEHPNVISGRTEIPGAVSREWVEQMRSDYGETGSIYRSRVLAEFPEDSIEGLIQREWIRDAFDRHESQPIPMQPDPVVLSLDVARYGADASCLADVRRKRVESLTTWRGLSITASADRAVWIAEHHSTKVSRPRIIVDDVGLGAGVTDVIRQKGWLVTAFNGAGKPPDSAHHLNLRAAAHWRLRELLERGEAALPRDAELEEELLALEWQLSPSGLIQILSKDLIRRTLGRSPDKADAVVMGLWESAGPPQPQWGNSNFSFHYTEAGR